MDDEISQKLCLGIDLGTTSVKICVINIKTREVTYTVSRSSHADIQSSLGSKGSEQNPLLIIIALCRCLESIPKNQQELIVKISVSGQMHGVMLWSKQFATERFMDQFQDEKGNNSDIKTSNLYTWQDQRCSSDFLSALPKPDSHLPLATGHGCATLLWLQKYQPNILIDFDCSGTVMDYLVTGLCGLDKPVTSAQLAASMGYFNTREMSWNFSQLTEAGLHLDILPYVVCPGHKAGTLQNGWFHIKPGTSVLAGLGDVQCAVYSVLKSPFDAVMNISTSCQLSFSVNGDELFPLEADDKNPVQYFPYFDDSYLVIAASLNGGNVLAHFVSMVRQWMLCFGCRIEEDQVWNTLLNVSLEESDSDGIKVDPTLFGERHNPAQTASISNIKPDNLHIGSVFRSICSGVLDNVCKMMPISFLQDNGIKTLIGSGSLLSRSKVMRQEVEKHFGRLKIEFGDRCDSATGAALYGSKHLEF